MSLDDGYKSVNLKDLGVSKEEASNTIDRFYNYLKENGNEIFRGRKRNKLF